MNKIQAILVAVVLLAVLIAFFMLYSPVPRNDVEFGRMVFGKILAGEVSVDEHIDWALVKMMGFDVAAQYATYAEAESKEAFRKALIKNISTSFAQTGGKISDFTDWRAHAAEGAVAVVAADYAKKDAVLLVKVTQVDGERKLAGIEWLATPGAGAGALEAQGNEEGQ